MFVATHVFNESDQENEKLNKFYREIHQSPDLELRTFDVMLHDYPNLQKIYKTRGTKRR